MEAILISGCLAGFNVKYNGGNNKTSLIDELKKKYTLIYICPEVDGGLPVPRDPSERFGKQVISNQNKDVTREFTVGAELALKKAIAHGVTKAVLKDGSPSCGSTYIYDGTFSHTRVNKKGLTAELLEANGITVYTENTIQELL